MDLFVLQPRSTSEGHLVIMWRPWLATVYAFTGCIYRNMFLSWGDSIKQVTLYPPTKSVIKLQEILWYDDESSDREITQPLFTIDQVMSFKETTKDNQINSMLCNIDYMLESDLASSSINQVLNVETQENSYLPTLLSLYSIPKVVSQGLEKSTLQIEVNPKKFMYINLELDEQQKNQLIELLKRQSGAFAWHYNDMRGISPDTYSHHIYT